MRQAHTFPRALEGIAPIHITLTHPVHVSHKGRGTASLFSHEATSRHVQRLLVSKIKREETLHTVTRSHAAC